MFHRLIDALERPLFARRVVPTDDRGTPLTPVSLDDFLKAGRDGDRVDPHRRALATRLADYARSRRLRGLRGFRRGSGTAAAYLVEIVGLAAIVAAYNAAPFTWRGTVVIAGLIAVSIASTRVRRRAVMQHAHAGTLVSEGYCGACGYSLENLPALDDGCLVCPECGHAWRTCRLTRPHWLHPPPAPAPVAERVRRWLVPRLPIRDRLVTDDRGRLVPVLGASVRALPRARRESLPGALGRALDRDLRRVGRWWRRAAAAAVVAVPTAVVLVSSPPTGVAIVLVVATLVIAAIILSSHFAVAWDAVAGAFLRHGLCPVCGCSLRDVAPADDGCAACPDCGASWRLPPAGAPVTPPPGPAPPTDPSLKPAGTPDR